ncbi:hypothetical protein VSH64_35860 [Amycolatopsis rhabdoformis]|uniref:Uncharacterized protein n=1 Tax=Amycolatopsis rhabdoformis TaxID=1448059 RepID=A0ABZ1I200_9PSEU|nr:hypothetical protein [Amycolatopsis rhabdoformis]WSE28179.1 hypothetical protein VSH64_35860 [Amycolatopsis rhabdoformis]
MGILRRTIIGTLVTGALLAVVAPGASAAPAGFRWDTFTGTATSASEPVAVNLATMQAENSASLAGYNAYIDCGPANVDVQQTQPDPYPEYAVTATLNCTQTTPDA